MEDDEVVEGFKGKLIPFNVFDWVDVDRDFIVRIKENQRVVGREFWRG